MRTTDFSAAPPQGRAGAFFFSCNYYHSPLGMVRQVIRWPKLSARLRATPGYLWHRSYYQFPLGIGLLVGFDTQESLKEFARTPEHVELMHWLLPEDPDQEVAKGGFIRILVPQEHGYTNGNCNAQGRMSMIRRFAPLAGESDPPATTPLTDPPVGPARLVRSTLAVVRDKLFGPRR